MTSVPPDYTIGAHVGQIATTIHAPTTGYVNTPKTRGFDELLISIYSFLRPCFLVGMPTPTIILTPITSLRHQVRFGD